MAERRILNSWKEIASYLGRGVRTVQRWEAQLGLPVHRPAGKDHSAVIAFSSELDQWLNLRPLRNSASDETQSTFDSAAAQALLGKTEVLLEKCEILLLRNDELARKISEVAEALHDEINSREARKTSSSRRVEAGVA